MPNRNSVIVATAAALVLLAGIVSMVVSIGRKSENLGVSGKEMAAVKRHFQKERKRPATGASDDLGEFVDELPDTSFATALMNALLKKFLENARAALRGEAVLKFDSKEAMEKFANSKLADGFRILGRSDQFNALRVGYDKAQDLWQSLVDSGVREGDLNIDANYLVTFPSRPAPDVGGANIAPQPDAERVGYNMLELLGVEPGQNSDWGAGMTVAVIDGIIQPHETFRDGQVRVIDLLGEDAVTDANDGHATAVASLYGGNDPRSPGIVPLVDILGYRVLDSNGNGDSFTLADAITQAASQRVDLINISLGSYGDSLVVADAVAYAESQGVMIISAAGNDGADSVTFPAGYDYVISAGSHDARGVHMNFSNSGKIDIAGPGYGLPAAWPGGVVEFSGTSALPAGAAILGVASAYDISTQEAYELVVANANEAGAPGVDPQHGAGNVHIGRALNANERGITDVGLASNYLDVEAVADGAQPIVQTTVENRGTEPIYNIHVNFASGNQRDSYQISRLEPGQIHTETVPVSLNNINNDGFLPVNTNVSLTGGQVDDRFRDNALTVLFPFAVESDG